MGKRVTYFGDCKSPSSAPADGISAGTGELNPVIKFSKIAGTLCLGSDVIINVVRAIRGDISWGVATMKSVMSIVEFGACSIPPIGLGLIIFDASGGFDNTLYNDLWLEDKHRYLKYEYEPSYYKYIPTSQSNYQHYY